ncbi:MAG: hypothetical protein ACOCUD_04745, partial [Bacillota bacterium]
MGFKDTVSLYKKTIRTDGSNERNELIYSIKDNFINSFDQNPSFKVVQLNEGNYDAHVFSWKDMTDDLKKIILKDYSASVSKGDLFNFDGYDWMVIDGMIVNKIIPIYGIQRCNHTLKWLNEEGSEKSSLCIIKDYKFTSSNTVSESEYIRVGDGVKYITLPYNSDTQEIKRDKRFIIGDKAYRTIEYDYITKDGLYFLTLEEHQINESTDDLENSIANAYRNTDYSIDIITSDISFSDED